MEIGWFLSMSGFLWVAAITPGPNNMLLTSAAANVGFIRAIPALLGIMLGMQALLIFVACGIGSLIILFPVLHFSLQLLGSGYLLWLAWKIASSRYEPLSTNQTQQPVTLYQAGLLQFLNPKAWLMALGAVASFSLANAYLSSIVAISVALAGVNLLAGFIWIGFGTLIGQLLSGRTAWFVFNIAMGILTALCVIFIWL